MRLSVSDQIAHEKKYAELSAQRYYHKQDKLRDGSRGDEVDAARSLMRQRIEEVGNTIEDLAKRKGGVGGKYNALLTSVATFDGETDFYVLAYMGIQAIFVCMHMSKGTHWVNVATEIANRLEFEHKVRKFEKANPGYYHTVMRSMEEQQVSSYKHIRNTLSAMMSKFDMEWEDWDSNTKIQLANKIILSILHNMDDVFYRGLERKGAKTIITIESTVLADEWLAEFEAERGYLNPIRLPTLIPPRDWFRDEQGVVTGGYYSYRLARSLVKAHTKEHIAFLAKHSMDEHISAVNKMQATKWRINQQVFEVQQDMFVNNITHPGIPNIKPTNIPEAPKELEGIHKEDMTDKQVELLSEWKAVVKETHRANIRRKGKIVQFKMAYDVAQMYKEYNEFHYVYTADFRGRIYADTTGLSPQGDDTSKALLEFANPKPVTSSGLFWLAVHGANTFGNDKVSFEDRANWSYEQNERIAACVANPTGYREWWGTAEKPWQFLAFCFAWAGTDYGANPDAPTSLPIGLDGSCNGIQHYSALLRDKVGGQGVNLTNSELPADIYQEVSDQLRRELDGSDNVVLATLWLRTGLGRKLAKRPVMTLPYGSTQTSARAYIFEWAMENSDKFPGMSTKEIFSACVWLTPLLWRAISKVVIAATEAMSWIQRRTSSSVAANKEAATWISPAGFPVYQPYVVHDTIRVATKLSGGIRIRLNIREPTEMVCKTKQRSGVTPNFVHSLDSSHMVKVVNASDFEDFAMIHDDFGTTAADVGKLYTTIRKEFVKMYSNTDLLREWSDQQGPYDGDYPKIGELDILEVLWSEYFFG